MLGGEAREAKQQHACSCAALPKDDLSEIRIARDEQASLFFSESEYIVIRGARSRFGNPDNVVAIVAEATYDDRLDILVRDKHVGRR